LLSPLDLCNTLKIKIDCFSIDNLLHSIMPGNQIWNTLVFIPVSTPALQLIMSGKSSLYYLGGVNLHDR
jgi:hypothetical protein